VRVLADENVPREAVERLRSAGHDITWMSEVEPGAADLAVLARAAAEGRVLVTCDKDFGEVAFKTAALLAAVNGVVLVRARRSDEIATLATDALAAHPDMSGLFVVAEPGRPPRANRFA
jgi:predicted nuclease of predicted toxin-antitoxin system